ncbi:MAG: DUF3240 family protein [Gammaproteobacteria bacterium]
MTPSTKPAVLLRINIPPTLEEDFLDALLSDERSPGYQCYPTTGHGQVGSMTLTEQVAGRRNRVQFEVVLPEELVEPVLAGLRDALPIRDIIWWVVPVHASSRFAGSD